MNKSVLKKLFSEKEQSVELSEVQVELASLDMIKAMYSDFSNLYKQGQSWSKEMDSFTKKSRELNRQASSLIAGLQKELNDFQRQAKELGLDVTNLPDYKKALDSIGPLDNIVKMTERFK